MKSFLTKTRFDESFDVVVDWLISHYTIQIALAGMEPHLDISSALIPKRLQEGSDCRDRGPNPWVSRLLVSIIGLCCAIPLRKDRDGIAGRDYNVLIT